MISLSDSELQTIKSNHEAPIPFIVCAANKYLDIIVCGARHFDMVMHSQIKSMREKELPINSGCWKQGFIDQFGNFHDRVAALAIAIEAGQVNVRRPKGHPEYKLFSEDLY